MIQYRLQKQMKEKEENHKQKIPTMFLFLGKSGKNAIFTSSFASVQTIAHNYKKRKRRESYRDFFIL